MSGFSLRYPFFIIMVCLAIAVVGVTTVARMPVDLFPDINIPVVVVATFYNGMPPEQIESNITNPLERFFTLGSGIDHIESRSLTGVSLIRVYFQPGTSGDAAVTAISNLALAQLRRLPPGTLPPVVLKFDASSLPVCLITLKGEGPQRNAAPRHCAVQRAQPDRGSPRSLRPAALRRQVSPDPNLRRSRQARSPPAQPHGCRPLRQPGQPDPSRRRRPHRPQRLQHLHQLAVPNHSGDRSPPTEDRRQRSASGVRHWLRQRRLRYPDQHRPRRWPALRLSAYPEAGRRQQHHCGRQRHSRGDQRSP